MNLMEFTVVGINPNDYASWNGTEVPAYITISEETLHLPV